ncbi:MAG: hypothetical protein LBT03_00185 [Holosporales bacterium]|jgi:hypothetical protein|nr:hypothetical protein [Holosporales bacterium]
MKIQFKFKKFRGNEEMIINNAICLSIIEAEGEFPVANTTFRIDECDAIKRFDICEISRNEQPFFVGYIKSFAEHEERLDVSLVALCNYNVTPSVPKTSDVVEKFKNDNPDIFTSLSKSEYTRLGKEIESGITTPREVLNITSSIIDGSLKMNISKDSPVGDLTLEIKGAWISKRVGSCQLSSKIANRFRSGKVNTLTPKKLVNSWHTFGDRISSGGKATKYFVNMSKLISNGTVMLPPIEVDSATPRAVLKKHIFDNRFGISWDYDQFMTEIVTMKFINNLHDNGNKKTLKINLKNVQEYLDNNESTTFFASENGKKILDAVKTSICNYITLSMRNITLSFEILDYGDSDRLDCSKWISVNGTSYKITKIERNVSPTESRIKIIAMGFENRPSVNFNTAPIGIEIYDSEENNIDIVQDIAIQNEGDVQYEKLLDYISKMKRLNKVTKDNYRKFITNFLNENPTKIQIILKPLKTKHCEMKSIDIKDPIFLEGGFT